MKSINTTLKFYVFAFFMAILLSNCGKKQKDITINSERINVTVSNPSTKDGGYYFSASGQIETEKFANISSRVMGYVKKIHVNVGSKVAKGQLLIQLNNSEMEAKRAQTKAQLLQAEVSFSTAKKDFERYKILYVQTSISQKEFDDINTTYEIAAAQVESVKQMLNEIDAMLSYSNIRSPFSGIITSKTINEGDMAKPGISLFSLESPGKYVATALVSETEIFHIKKGQAVEVFIKSSDKKMQGSVSEFSTSSQNTGGLYLVKINLNHKNIKLFSGMFVSTNFPIKNGVGNVIIVPKSALINKGQLTGLYTVSKSNTAILRWLKLGKSMGNEIEVLTGLSKDEQYIVSADGRLYNGVKINIK